MENYIVGLGEILFDCLPDGKKLGGAPANFAYHVSQFGLNGIAVSAIGDDEDGREIVRQLTEHTKKNSPLGEQDGAFHLEKVAQPTGTVQVTLSGNGIPQYDICLGVAYDNIPWTPAIENIAKNARAVCFGSLAQRTAVSRETIYKFLDTMPASPPALPRREGAPFQGTLKIFDINLRQSWYSKEVIEESLKRCNVLKINDEEIIKVAELLGSPLQLPEGRECVTERLLQPVEFEDFCQKLIKDYKLQMIVLTCGAFGSYVVYNGSPLGESEAALSFQPTPKVQVADTVGAGDSFTGSFCAAILAGKPIKEAHKIGVEVSAYVCTQKGAMPEYPAELLSRLGITP